MGRCRRRRDFLVKIGKRKIGFRNPPPWNAPIPIPKLKVLAPASKGDETPSAEKIFESPLAFMRALEKRGFRYIGSGAYSSVYWKEGSDKVIKIGRRPEQDGWPVFALWANDNGFGGSFAPKLYSYKRYGTFYVASMEKLKAISYTDDKEASVFYRMAEMALLYKNDVATEVCDLLDSRWKTFYTLFSKDFRTIDLDWHGGNLMCREDGSFVIADPFAGVKNQVKTTRWKAEETRPTPFNRYLKRDMYERTIRHC